jgi:hypothetical protein
MNRRIAAALLALFVGLTVDSSWVMVRTAALAQLLGELTSEDTLLQEATKRGLIPKDHLGLFQETFALGLLMTEPSKLDEGGIYLQAGNEVIYLSPEGGGVALSDHTTKKRMRQLGTNALEENVTKGTIKAWMDGSFQKVASTQYPVQPTQTTALPSRLGS